MRDEIAESSPPFLLGLASKQLNKAKPLFVGFTPLPGRETPCPMEPENALYESARRKPDVASARWLPQWTRNQVPLHNLTVRSKLGRPLSAAAQKVAPPGVAQTERRFERRSKMSNFAVLLALAGSKETTGDVNPRSNSSRLPGCRHQKARQVIQELLPRAKPIAEWITAMRRRRW